MKINRKFVQDNPDAWERLRADHVSFSQQRHLWRLKLARAKPASAACCVGIILIDRFGGLSDRNPNGDVFPSQPAIAEESGLSEGEVRYGVDELRRLGLIATRKPGLNKSLHYIFTDPEFVATLRSEVAATVRDDDAGASRSGVGTAVRSEVGATLRSEVGTANNMTTEHDHGNMNAGLPCDGAPAVHDLPPVDHPFASVEAQGVEVPREEQMDELLACAIRDGEDADIRCLSDQELRDAFKRRYGSQVNQLWWMIAEWLDGNIEWIDCISELERMDEGEEEILQHG